MLSARLSRSSKALHQSPLQCSMLLHSYGVYQGQMLRMSALCERMRALSMSIAREYSPKGVHTANVIVDDGVIDPELH